MPVIIKTDDSSVDHDVLDGSLNIPEESLSKKCSSEDVENLTNEPTKSVCSAFLTEVEDYEEEADSDDEKDVHEYPRDIRSKAFEQGNKTSTFFISVNQDEAKDDEEDMESLPNLEKQKTTFDISESIQNKVSEVTFEVNSDDEEEAHERSEMSIQIGASESKYSTNESESESISFVSHRVVRTTGTLSQERSSKDEQSKEELNLDMSSGTSFVTHHVMEVNNDSNDSCDDTKKDDEEKIEKITDDSGLNTDGLEASNQETISQFPEATSEESEYSTEEISNEDDEMSELNENESECHIEETENQNDEILDSSAKESKSPVEEEVVNCVNALESNAEVLEDSIKNTENQTMHGDLEEIAIDKGHMVEVEPLKISSSFLAHQVSSFKNNLDDDESDLPIEKDVSKVTQQLNKDNQRCVEEIEREDHSIDLHECTKESKCEEIVVATSQDIEQIPEEPIEIIISNSGQKNKDLNDKIDDIDVENKVESMSNQGSLSEEINDSVNVHDIVNKEESTNESIIKDQHIESDTQKSSIEVNELETKIEHFTCKSMESGVEGKHVLDNDCIQTTEENSHIIVDKSNTSPDEQKLFKSEITIEVDSVKDVDDSPEEIMTDSDSFVNNRVHESMVEAHQQEEENTSELHTIITNQSLNSEEISKIENKIVEEEQYLELNKRKLNNDAISISNLPEETITSPELSLPLSAEKMFNKETDKSSCAKNQESTIRDANAEKSIVDNVPEVKLDEEVKNSIDQEADTSPSLNKDLKSSSKDESLPSYIMEQTTTTKNKIRDIGHSVGETFNLQSVAGEAKSKMESFMGDLNRGSKTLASKIIPVDGELASSEHTSSSDNEQESDKDNNQRSISTDFLYSREELTYMGLAFLALLIGFLIQFV